MPPFACARMPGRRTRRCACCASCASWRRSGGRKHRGRGRPAGRLGLLPQAAAGAAAMLPLAIALQAAMAAAAAAGERMLMTSCEPTAAATAPRWPRWWPAAGGTAPRSCTAGWQRMACARMPRSAPSCWRAMQRWGRQARRSSWWTPWLHVGYSCSALHPPCPVLRHTCGTRYVGVAQ
jgi:hypothetical protein